MEQIETKSGIVQTVTLIYTGGRQVVLLSDLARRVEKQREVVLRLGLCVRESERERERDFSLKRRQYLGNKTLLTAPVCFSIFLRAEEADYKC